jgi:hypothetical protein
VSHPSLGRAPLDPAAGHPSAAAIIRTGRERLASRGLEALAVEDPTLGERHDELALRRLLRDAGTMLDLLATAVGTGDAEPFVAWSEAAVPVFRRRRVPMDDLIRLLDQLDRVVAAAVDPDAAAAASDALAAAAGAFKAHRRLAGDAKKRNPIAAFIYKGA